LTLAVNRLTGAASGARTVRRPLENEERSVSVLRRLVVPLGVIAALLLALLFNPWLVIEESLLRQVLTVAFWVAFIVLLVALFEDRKSTDAADVEIEGPRFARFLFTNSRAGLFWLPIRLFLGFAWLDSGWHKFTDPGWMQGGTALRAYWERAAAIPEQGRPPITYEWYREFINTLLAGGHESWMAYLVTFGELAVGLGLLVGALTGVAAFFGALMNMSFLLAGSASTNPILFTMAIGLILAWRVAGYYGLDRYLLPALGAPWRPGEVFQRGHETGAATG
jgi:thiosulfate dehydrogenase [quinone] large subunit